MNGIFSEVVQLSAILSTLENRPNISIQRTIVLGDDDDDISF